MTPYSPATRHSKVSLFVFGGLFVLMVVVLSTLQHELSARGREIITGAFRDQFSQAQLAQSTQFAKEASFEMNLVASELQTLSQSTGVGSLDSDACSTFVSEVLERSYLSMGTLSRTNRDQIFDCSNLESTIGVDGATYPYLNTLFSDPSMAIVVGRPLVSRDELGNRYFSALHVPLFDAQGEFVGSLGSAIFLDELMAEIVQNAAIRPSTRINLIDDTGMVVYNSHNEYIGQNIFDGPLSLELQKSSSLREKILRRELGESGIFDFTLENETRIGAYKSFETPDGKRWYITVVHPFTDINPIVLPLISEIGNEFVLMSAVAFMLLTVFFLSLLFWNRRLQRTIERQSADLKERNEQMEQNIIKLQHQERRMEISLKESKETENKAQTYLKRSERTKVAMMNILEDVEEERTKSLALANDLKKFELAINSTSDQVIITDPHAVILFANPAVERITGYSPQEVIGKRAGAKELWGGNMPESFYKEMWHTISVKKESFQADIQNTRKNGETYIAHTTISPILSAEGKIQFFVGIERDITREKEIDRAKTEFVSLASHQLRTPLSAINWYTEMLLSGDAGAINDDQRVYLKEIYTGNKRMVDLVNALLNVSRIELGTFIIEPKLRSLANMIRAEVKELEPLSKEKELTITTKLGSAVPRLKVDPKLMRIIVDNLLTNAVKYTPKGGHIEARLSKKKDVVVFSVSDTGYGIPASQQDKIFTKLFRADNIQKRDTVGTGLGLYIVKLILDNSGGRIWFESEEEKGTTFYVEIPLSGMQKKDGTKELDS